MSRPSKTRRALRSLAIAVTGAAVALGAVFLVHSGSSGASDPGTDANDHHGVDRQSGMARGGAVLCPVPSMDPDQPQHSWNRAGC